MVMMITRFHRLIQSRLLWGAFLVIIIFTFVIWGTQTPSESRKAQEANAAGKLDGKLVSRDEFTRNYFNTYMSAVLSVGRRFDIDDELDVQIREAAWRRLVAIREAGRMGIGATDEEVLATIQSHPGFSVDGRFREDAYIAFVQNMLAPMGFTSAQFEEHVRQEIILQKLQRVIQQAVLVPPFEIARTFRSLTDTFDVQYAIISPADVEKSVKVTADDARALYLSNPAAFTIPPQVRVKYVEIPVEKFLADAVVTNEMDALGYYDEHIDEYVVTNEVTVKRTEIGENGELVEVDVTTNRPETLGFDVVKTNILEALTLIAAQGKAQDTAVDFVVSLAPDRQGNAPSFEDAAARANLEVKTLAPFGLRDEVPGIDAGMAFNAAAFALNPNPEEYFSDAIVGSNFVYVIGLDQKIDARVPEFAEVEELAMTAAREKALEDALAQQAQKVRDAAVEAVAKGGTFKAAAGKFDLEVKETGDFTVAEGLETNEYSEILVRGVLPRNQGEVTDPLYFEDGVVIGFIAKRVPGDASVLASISPQIRDTVRQQRTRILFEDWQAHLLQNAGFEDLMPSRSEEEEGVGDEDQDWQDEPAEDQEADEASREGM